MFVLLCCSLGLSPSLKTEIGMCFSEPTICLMCAVVRDTFEATRSHRPRQGVREGSECGPRQSHADQAISCRVHMINKVKGRGAYDTVFRSERPPDMKQITHKHILVRTPQE